MRLTKMVSSGTRVIFDIAYHSAGLPIQTKDISTRQAIPLTFLRQLLYKLKNLHIIKSVRGPGGGYVLAKDPERITVKDIIKAMKEPVDIVFCVDNPAQCQRSKHCVTRLVWKEAAGKINKFFDSVSFADLCRRARSMGVK